MAKVYCRVSMLQIKLLVGCKNRGPSLDMNRIIRKISSVFHTLTAFHDPMKYLKAY